MESVDFAIALERCCNCIGMLVAIASRGNRATRQLLPLESRRRNSIPEGIACRWSQLQGNWQALHYKATVIVPTDPSFEQFHFVDFSVPRNYGAKRVATYQSRRRSEIQRIASNLALDLKLKQPLERATRARLKARVKEIASWPKCRAKIRAKRTDNLKAKRSVLWQVRAKVRSVESDGKRVERSCDKTLYDRERGNYGGQSVKSKMQRKHDRSKFKV